MLETKSDFQSAEEWAKKYRPLKRSGNRPARVGGTLFDDLTGTEGKFIRSEERQFVWSVFSNGYFEFIQNGLIQGAVGYLLSDNPELTKDQGLKFAIGYDSIDWNAFERFQNGETMVAEEAKAEEIADRLDHDNEAEHDDSEEDVTVEPAAVAVFDEDETAVTESPIQEIESLEAVPLEGVHHEPGALSESPDKTEEEALTEIAAETEVIEDERSSAEYEYPPAEHYYQEGTYLETEPIAVAPVEPVAEEYSDEVQPDDTLQAGPEASYNPPAVIPEVESVEDPHYDPLVTEVAPASAEEYPETEKHTVEVLEELPYSLVEPTTSDIEPGPQAPEEYQHAPEAIAEEPQQWAIESVVEDPAPEPQALVRQLPFDYEAARLDYDIYGEWPGATQCKSCCGSGFYAGITMTGIGCPDCAERGWNPPPGSPHEIPVVV
jgi:hypothetical protein